MDRGERRRRTEVKLTSRLCYNNNPACQPDGKMRKTPKPCSCWMCSCRSWKKEDKYKPSERRKLQDG